MNTKSKEKEESLERRVNPIVEANQLLNQFLINKPPYINGIISSIYDIFATTHGLSPPFATPLTHAYWAILGISGAIDDNRVNKKVLIGNMIGTAAYCYYSYGEPIRNFLDNNIIW